MTRKVVLKMLTTLDGFVGASDGSVDWAFPSFDDEFTAWGVDALRQAGVHVMGAETGRGLAAYWPNPAEERDLPFAPLMNETPKVVFSKTLDHLDWNQTRIARGDTRDEIERLKAEGDGDVLVHGGARFAQSLTRFGLIDEYHLMVLPVVLGNGLRLFSEMSAPLRLEVMEVRPFASGAVLHVLRQPAASRQSSAIGDCDWSRSLNREEDMVRPPSNKLRVTTPNDNEIVMTREFDASRQMVFDAHTKPEHIVHWFGLRGESMPVCEVDLRVGGYWRYVLSAPGGEMGIYGTFQEIDPPSRIVTTENFEGDLFEAMGGGTVNTMILEEHDGKTTMTITVNYRTSAQRDAVLQTPMEQGAGESFDRLEEYLQTLS